MSDYRYSIGVHNDLLCLHVVIDTEPMVETHIPISDILASYASYLSKQENIAIYQQWKQAEENAPVAHQEALGVTGMLEALAEPHPSERGLYEAWRKAIGQVPEGWKLPESMRGGGHGV